MKTNNINWGLFFLAAAGSIVLNTMGFLEGIGFWTVIISILLIPIFVRSIVKLSWGGIFFPLAIVAILYDEQLGIESFTPWPCLACAVFLTFGFSMIFPKKHFWNEFDFNGKCIEGSDGKMHKHDNSEDWVNESMDGEHINMTTRFGGSVKYVTSENLKDVDINCSFSGMKVYFDNTQLAGNSAVVNCNVEFAGLEIFVPKTWRVKIDTSCMLGGVDEKGLAGADKGENTLYIKGNVKFAGITIIYI